MGQSTLPACRSNEPWEAAEMNNQEAQHLTKESASLTPGEEQSAPAQAAGYQLENSLADKDIKLISH